MHYVDQVTVEGQITDNGAKVRAELRHLSSTHNSDQLGIDLYSYHSLSGHGWYVCPNLSSYNGEPARSHWALIVHKE